MGDVSASPWTCTPTSSRTPNAKRSATRTGSSGGVPTASDQLTAESICDSLGTGGDPVLWRHQAALDQPRRYPSVPSARQPLVLVDRKRRYPGRSPCPCCPPGRHSSIDSNSSRTHPMLIVSPLGRTICRPGRSTDEITAGSHSEYNALSAACRGIPISSGPTPLGGTSSKSMDAGCQEPRPFRPPPGGRPPDLDRPAA